MESVEFRPDGTIKFVFPVDGSDITYGLRRPRIGEFRKLWESVLALDEEARQQREEKGSVDQEASLIAHMRNVVQLLSETPLPDSDDDLPLWFTNGALPIDMVVHWRTVPLVPGQKGPSPTQP